MKAKLSGLVATVIGAATAGAVLRGKVRRYEIVEHSMSPELEPGDYVFAVAARRELMRGDVVIFGHPDRPGFELVKRVIGMPGETVTVADGQVHIDGALLPDPWAVGPTRDDGTWRLGAEVFVLGDQRAHSAGDSRQIGPVPRNAISWRCAARYWPAHRIGAT